jgi:membrane protein implicated in regulation of membrane protease activity
LLWLAAGAALLAFFVFLGRATPAARRTGGWRVAAGVLAVVALVGGAVFAVRGLWAPALALLLGGLTTAVLARRPQRPRSSATEMSEEQARGLLGVSAEADEEAVQAAYVRLMRRVHPDAGGATGLAAQLNAARDRLLNRR